jgi:hypothetical protein
MYMFISLLYFLVILTFGHNGTSLEETMSKQTANTVRKQINSGLEELLTLPQANASDTLRASLIKDLKVKLHLDSTKSEDFNMQVVGDFDYKQLRRYDSLQHALPEDKRDKGIVPWVFGRWLKTINHYQEATISIMVTKTRNIIPKMMFVLLPLFALFLNLFYRRKNYAYTEHAIFSLHFHSAVFLIFLVTTCLDMLSHSWIKYISNIELLLAFVYLTIALRNAYKQSVFVSILKSIGLSLIYGVFILAGFILVGLSTLFAG